MSTFYPTNDRDCADWMRGDRSRLARSWFYPKPRVALGKGPQPLRCNPIVVEQIRP
jgi:hypothetical protein